LAISVYLEVDVESYRGAAPDGDSAIRGPSALHSMTELPRVLLEVAGLAYAWPWLGGAPRGDGHPVLVLPGFTAGDASTTLLRRFLARLGYRPLPWGLGQNTGRVDLQEQLVRRVRTLTAECDEEISLVGQSLGGVFARELARLFPDRIRQVISLGSPFSSPGPDSTHPVVARLFQYLSGMSRGQMRDQMLRYAPEAPPVPSTAVYSRADGVVHWSSCLEYHGSQAENVEVLGSHSGMAVNPLVLHVIADRLAQPPGAWRPFRPPGGCRGLYPEPAPLARPRAAPTQETPSCAN
jgi:pimeloyl-ACP methyl ester carboxylesterase